MLSKQSSIWNLFSSKTPVTVLLVSILILAVLFWHALLTSFRRHVFVGSGRSFTLNVAFFSFLHWIWRSFCIICQHENRNSVVREYERKCLLLQLFLLFQDLCCFMMFVCYWNYFLTRWFCVFCVSRIFACDTHDLLSSSLFCFELSEKKLLWIL